MRGFFFLQDFCGILKKIVQDKVQDFSKKKTDFRDFLGNPARLCYFRSGSTAQYVCVKRQATRKGRFSYSKQFICYN
jgi:hypothetical protein